MAHYNFTELENVVRSWSAANIRAEVSPQPNNVTMIAGGTEMLRVAEDGFYVRGVKVPADDKEAETVYNAFKQFLVWAELNRQ